MGGDDLLMFLYHHSHNFQQILNSNMSTFILLKSVQILLSFPWMDLGSKHIPFNLFGFNKMIQ